MKNNLKPPCECVSCRRNRILDMPFGAERRKLILEFLETRVDGTWPYGMIINSRYQASMRYDKDLQHLVKKGKLLQLPKQHKIGRKWVNVLVLSKYYENFQLK